MKLPCNMGQVCKSLKMSWHCADMQWETKGLSQHSHCRGTTNNTTPLSLGWCNSAVSLPLESIKDMISSSFRALVCYNLMEASEIFLSFAFFVTALCVVNMRTCRQHAYTAICQSVASCCLLGSWPYPHPKLNGMRVSTQQKSCAFESRVAGLNPCRCLPNFTAFPTLSWAIKKMGRRDDDCKGSCNTCWLWYTLPSGVLLLLAVYVFLCVLTLHFCSWKLPFSMGSSMWKLLSTACWMLSFCPLGLEKQKPKPKALGFLLVLLSVGSR